MKFTYMKWCLLCTFFSIGLSSSRHDRYKELYEIHNFSRVTDQGAVGDAIAFLMKQDENLDEETAKLRIFAQKHKNYHTLVTDKTLPLCNVTFDSIRDDGVFVYLGDNVTPPYDYASCFVMFPRYHVAPECERLERQEGYPQLYQWKWMLEAARQGKCRMPEPTPLAAGVEYLRRKAMRGRPMRPVPPTSKYNDTEGKVVNILWLGLSFMGQPFLSSICMNPNMKGGGGTISTGKGLKDIVPFKDAVDSTGRCSLPCEDCFPRSLHKGVGPEYQSPTKHCRPAVSEYRTDPTNGEDPVTVRICYAYTFNLKLNMKKLYSTLPCSMQWNDIDVIFGLHPYEEFSGYYIPGTNAKFKELMHVTYVSVSQIYQGILTSQLKAAYSKYGFPPLTINHLRGKPSNCDRPDIHFRMPGLTDFASQAWFSLLATGLQVFDDCQPSDSCYKHKKKLGAIEIWN